MIASALSFLFLEENVKDSIRRDVKNSSKKQNLEQQMIALEQCALGRKYYHRYSSH